MDEDTSEHKIYRKPMELFEDLETVKICSPMVRYSKLAFRSLVRKYGCNLAYTPMIIADSFVRSLKARDSEFTTNEDDRPLIVQFAANSAKDFAEAAEIVAPYADGIGLNCGCPQRWAMAEGYGACMLRKPELLADMVAQARARLGDSDFTVSIKIRIHNDLKDTVEFCRRAERVGASWVTVHGRTPEQRNQPVNHDAIRHIKDSLSIPVVANGDICSLDDVKTVHELTGVDGVMAARGMLANPAMYAAYEHTPLECVRDWLDLSLSLGTPYTIFHHHLINMLDTSLPRAEKRVFNGLTSTGAVLDFLNQSLGV